MVVVVACRSHILDGVTNNMSLSKQCDHDLFGLLAMRSSGDALRVWQSGQEDPSLPSGNIRLPTTSTVPTQSVSDERKGDARCVGSVGVVM